MGTQNRISATLTRSLEKLEGKLTRELQSILLQEETYWQQTSRERWICYGERNTRYFHASTIDRRRRTQIHQLRPEDHSWCTEQPELKHMVSTFYKQLYSKEIPPTSPTDQWHLPRLSCNCVRWLNRGITDHEIKTAFFQIRAHKAPGPDGFLACFYHKFWPLVGETVTQFVQGIFHTREVPEQLNLSTICLIPKTEHPEFVSQFRSICLNNVIVKVISKIIANLLNPLMNDLTRQNQASFVPGRQTTDNIVMAQELLHSL